jgi:putative copper resistance protein D
VLGRPSAWSLLAPAWDAAPAVVVAALVAAGLVLQARGRGAHVSGRRIAALAGAVGAIALATATGIGRYDDALFSVHVVQHLLLGMVAPILLVLSRPVTLALQACNRPTRARLLRVLHRAGPLTHPLTAWLLFAPALFVLYFSPLYAATLRHPLLHDAVHVHFVVAGTLFFSHVIGVDPLGHRLAHGTRLLYVGVLVPLHAFLGLAIVYSSSLLGGVPPVRVAGVDLLADQRVGGAVLWLGGDMLMAAVVLVVVVQWMAADVRVAAGEDRAVAAAGSDARNEAGDLPCERLPRVRFDRFGAPDQVDGAVELDEA